MENLFKFYKFYAFLFSYPSDGSFFENLERFYPFEDKLPLERLKRVPLGELQAEYTSLFEVKPGGVPCKPYQSFFGSERSLMGDAAFSTNRFFGLFNLETGGEIPDRANLQLDFAAFLVRLISSTSSPAERRKLETLYRDFFKKHILWLEKLADCVSQNGSLEEIKPFMEFLKSFLQKERERLKL